MTGYSREQQERDFMPNVGNRLGAGGYTPDQLAAMSPKGTPAVAIQLGHLQESLGRLEKELGALLTRLEPVLRIEVEVQSANKTAPETPPSTCPLAESLRLVHVEATKLRRRVERTQARLEI